MTLFKILTPVRKFIGLFWYWFICNRWCRKYSRSVVQNGALQGIAHLDRLMQRKPDRYTFDSGCKATGWVLRDVVHNVGRQGFVTYRKVSKLEFWLVVFFIWGWLDDDAYNDTYSASHCKRYTEGDLQNSIMARLFRKQLLRAIDSGYDGNSFDLGDIRAEHRNFNFIAVLIWLFRNTAYNFYYLFGEPE